MDKPSISLTHLFKSLVFLDALEVQCDILHPDLLVNSLLIFSAKSLL